MSDIIMKPAANAEGDFTGALEFPDLDVADTGSAAVGVPYDIYAKVGSQFSLAAPAQITGEIIGGEPVFTIPDNLSDEPLSIAFPGTAFAGPYTQDHLGNTLTANLIATSGAFVGGLSVSGLDGEDEVLTVSLPLYLFSGNAPAAPSIVMTIGGVTVAEDTLTYTQIASDGGKTLNVTYTYGSATIATSRLMNFSPFGILDPTSKVVVLDALDDATMWSDDARTIQSADEDLVHRVDSTIGGWVFSGNVEQAQNRPRKKANGLYFASDSLELLNPETFNFGSNMTIALRFRIEDEYPNGDGFFSDTGSNFFGRTNKDAAVNHDSAGITGKTFVNGVEVLPHTQGQLFDQLFPNWDAGGFVQEPFANIVFANVNMSNFNKLEFNRVLGNINGTLEFMVIYDNPSAADVAKIGAFTGGLS